ncbi:uncharacterized protein Triagg1_1845 [Trichoderma aggressivum f. europaeum]|uniref:Secreted protein n=1 Tax=Trichoderma aggressivum f. europaeum TaxID=173218 RepID=A0AAE1ILA0_9HYPO|nr:hypothetical protein Triagg1_1845 [Trichoderma aggressivum f. europaeum]
MKTVAAIPALFAGLSIAGPLQARQLPDRFDINGFSVQCQTSSCEVKFGVTLPDRSGGCVIAFPGIRAGIPDFPLRSVCDQPDIGYEVIMHDQGFGGIDFSVDWNYASGKYLVGNHSIPGSQWQAFGDGDDLLERYTGPKDFSISDLQVASSI